MPKRKSQLYIEDIVTALRHIRAYTKGRSFVTFAGDQKTIDAVMRNLEIIGEAARFISSEIIENHPEIPWRNMADLRNKVSHEYFGIDLEIIWQTIEDDLPLLTKQINRLKKLEI